MDEMRKESMQNGVMFCRSGEEWVKIGGICSVPDFQPDNEQQEEQLLLNKHEFTCEMKPGKVMRCKSRKRFVKLLMSIGVSRNQAAEFANKIPAHMPYSSAWWWIKLLHLGGFEA